jgi:hypothetical protein
VTKTKEASEVPQKTGLELLREPFPPHQIGKLAKETKLQKEARNNNKALGIRCEECGIWHHKDAVHLDYVGHAALTDRLLDADPMWFWEPMAVTEQGLPCFDKDGGLWIKLTVCGMTRLGYGNAPDSDYKDIGSREKEVIGDALRNAAMRFGAALELWHKGVLHMDEDTGEIKKETITARGGARNRVEEEQLQQIDKLASGILDAFTDNQPDLAFAKYMDARLQVRAYGADGQAAFWDKFDSKQRATLSRMLEAKRKEDMGEMYGQQA